MGTTIVFSRFGLARLGLAEVLGRLHVGVLPEQPPDLGHLTAAAHEAGQLRGQITRSAPHRCHNKPTLRYPARQAEWEAYRSSLVKMAGQSLPSWLRRRRRHLFVVLPVAGPFPAQDVTNGSGCADQQGGGEHTGTPANAAAGGSSQAAPGGGAVAAQVL
jgi:hypothetical protein